MTTRMLLMLLALSCCADTAWSEGSNAGQNAVASQEVQEGRWLAEVICSNCHVISPDQSYQPTLRPPAPPFETLAQRSTMNDAWLRTFLATTHREQSSLRGMPNPQLIDSHIRQVAAYLLSLHKQPGAQATEVPRATEATLCNSEIARLETELRHGRAMGMAPTSVPESTAARLHRQPTQKSVENAAAEAGKEIAAVLSRARALEQEGKEADCLAEVKRVAKVALPGGTPVAANSSAFAATRRTEATATADIRQLLRMMEKDRGGSVSKDEFMQFMSQMFDRMANSSADGARTP